jgi:hypothetical protein
MVKLYEITEAQATAMSAAEAAKYLAENSPVDADGDDKYGEMTDRALAGYALDYDNGTPKPPFEYQDGDYSDVGPEGIAAFKYWEKELPYEKLMEVTVGEAMGLREEVKEILEKKVNGPLKAFKEEASEATKAKYEAASEANKAVILAAWVKSHGKTFDGGRRRRKTRKGRKGSRKGRKATRRR